LILTRILFFVIICFYFIFITWLNRNKGYYWSRSTNMYKCSDCRESACLNPYINRFNGVKNATHHQLLICQTQIHKLFLSALTVCWCGNLPIDSPPKMASWRTSVVGPSIVFTCQSCLCKSPSPAPSLIIGQ